MMFLWIPFLMLIGLLAWRLGAPGDAAVGCCGMTHAGHGSPSGPASGPGDPVLIVRERLARGEITAEEYERLVRTLG